LGAGHPLVGRAGAEQVRRIEEGHLRPDGEDEPLKATGGEVPLARPAPILREEDLPHGGVVGEPEEERPEHHISPSRCRLHHAEHVLRPAIQDPEVVAELQVVEDRVVAPRCRQSQLPQLPDALPLDDVPLVDVDGLHCHSFRYRFMVAPSAARGSPSDQSVVSHMIAAIDSTDRSPSTRISSWTWPTGFSPARWRRMIASLRTSRATAWVTFSVSLPP